MHHHAEIANKLTLNWLFRTIIKHWIQGKLMAQFHEKKQDNNLLAPTKKAPISSLSATNCNLW